MKLLAVLALSLPGCAAQDQGAPKRAQDKSVTMVYVGTYTGSGSKGIYLFELESGTLKPRGAAEGVASPSFLAVHEAGKILFAACETSDFQGKKTGSVAAFKIHPDGAPLTLINAQSSGGAGPCYVSVNRDARHVFVANYGGGSVAMLPFNADTGLGAPARFFQHEGSGANPQRQKGPHAHSINLDPAERFALAADLGLDKILVYRFDAAKGTLEANDPPFGTTPPGGGPRHLAFSPGGKFLYVNNEMTSSVTAFRWEADRGAMTEIHTLSTLPDGFKGSNSTAETRVSPDGRFVYVSNRGHDSIAIFSADPATGRLTAAGHAPSGGKTPRNFGIDPSGRHLIAANQGSNTLVVFSVDPKTGALTPTGQVVEVPKPVCVRFGVFPRS